MEKIACGADTRSRSTSTADRGEIAMSPGPRRTVRDLTVVILDRPRHEEIIGRIRRRRAHPVDQRRRRRGRSWRPARTRASTCCRASAAHPRASCRRRHSSASAARSRGGSGRGTTTSAAPPRGRLRPREGPHHERPGRGDNVFFAATGITDGDLLRGVKYHGAARGRIRSSCARSRAPCARSRPRTRLEKLEAVAGERYR